MALSVVVALTLIPALCASILILRSISFVRLPPSLPPRAVASQFALGEETELRLKTHNNNNNEEDDDNEMVR